MDFTDLFRDHLRRRGFSHARFAALAHVSPAFISLVATRRAKPPLDAVDAWADALGLVGAERELFLDLAHLRHASPYLQERWRSLAEAAGWTPARAAEPPAAYRSEPPRS